LIDELPPERRNAAAQALRSLRIGAATSVSARFVSSSAGESGTVRAISIGELGYGLFEQYTEPARRTIFFARYEASPFGSKAIESEHLLLGLLREHPRLADRLDRRNASASDI
jgi:hypothetical protein